MSLFSKMADLFEAKLNHLLDNASDPVETYNLMLHRAEEFRTAQLEAIGKAVTAEERLKADLDEARWNVERDGKRAAGWAEKKNDEMAKAALRLQMTHEQQVAVLKPAYDAQVTAVNGLQADLATLDAKIEELHGLKSVVEARVTAARAQKAIRGPIDQSKRGPNMEAIRHRVDEQVRDLEAQARASARVAGLVVPQTDEAKLEAGDRDEELERRLAALKAGK